MSKIYHKDVLFKCPTFTFHQFITCFLKKVFLHLHFLSFILMTSIELTEACYNEHYQHYMVFNVEYVYTKQQDFMGTHIYVIVYFKYNF